MSFNHLSIINEDNARMLFEMLTGTGQPNLIVLSSTILTHRKEYYEALEAANKANEITGWLAWFAGITLEAQRRALAQAQFILDKARLLDSLRGVLNERQQKALLREGPDGFVGGLSAGKYIAITGAPRATFRILSAGQH